MGDRGRQEPANVTHDAETDETDFGCASTFAEG
jgi:hypothetical protein